MPWDEMLTDEQRTAASHNGGHACLLSGPGTGKTLTLTRHICYLIEEQSVEDIDRKIELTPHRHLKMTP